MLIQKLIDKKLITPPRWLENNTCFLTYMGSYAYGTSLELSDKDIWGIAIPPIDQIFPSRIGIIPGFGNQGNKFDEYEQHHVIDKDENQEYDIKVMSIVKFFELARLGNPNTIDAIFTPQNCIIKMTNIGNIIRENRKLFLSKLCFQKFKGYAFSQYKKIQDNKAIGKRKELIEKYGWDLKYGMHLVRLLNEIEQILMYGDLDLQLNKEQNKSIRRGEWSIERLNEYFTEKEKDLESLYIKSDLRKEPDEAKLKEVLLECLEAHYGNLDKEYTRQDQSTLALREISLIIEKYNVNKT